MKSVKPYLSLQDWMERTGTSQVRLAKLAGIATSQLSSLLKGSRRCSLMKAFALSRVTGVPVENLVKWPKIPIVRTSLRVGKIVLSNAKETINV